MTKCILNTYGPSGSIQNHDALCVMTVNVLNEKIYFLVWIVFMALAIFTIVYQIIAAVILSYRKGTSNSVLIGSQFLSMPMILQGFPRCLPLPVCVPHP
jgi:hypothetical protein